MTIDWDSLGPLGFEAAQRAARTVARSFSGVEEDDLYQEAVIYYATHPEEMQRQIDYGESLPGVKGGEAGALKALQRQLVSRLREWASREARQHVVPIARPRSTEPDLARFANRPTPEAFEGKPYTPAIVEATLPALFNRPAERPELGAGADPGMPKSSVDPSHLGTWMAHQADVRRAFAELDVAHRQAAFAITALGLALDDAAELLDVDRSTATRRNDRAIEAIATTLNGDTE